MANKYLARDDAPFGSDIWEALDGAMIQAAKGFLVGRKLLELEGPYGLGLKSVPLKDTATESGLIVGTTLPLILIQEGFDLAARDLASFEMQGITLDRSAVAEAALSVAKREDDLIFNGSKELGVEGLMTAEDASRVDLSDWSDVGAAANNLIQAVTTLDEAGFHGPYTLALAPARYNLLFRRYERGNFSEMEHVKTLVTDGGCGGRARSASWRARQADCGPFRGAQRGPEAVGRWRTGGRAASGLRHDGIAVWVRRRTPGRGLASSDGRSRIHGHIRGCTSIGNGGQHRGERRGVLCVRG